MGYEPTPNWEDWTGRKFWELREAAALVMGMNPPFIKAVLPNPLKAPIPVVALPNEFHEGEARKYECLLGKAVEAVRGETLQVHDNLHVNKMWRVIGLGYDVCDEWVKPNEFLLWAREQGYPIPHALEGLLRTVEEGGAEAIPVSGHGTESQESGLTVTEAAQMYVKEMEQTAENDLPLRNAKAHISKACNKGRIKSTGERTKRRVNEDPCVVGRLHGSGRWHLRLQALEEACHRAARPPLRTALQWGQLHLVDRCHP